MIQSKLLKSLAIFYETLKFQFMIWLNVVSRFEMNETKFCHLMIQLKHYFINTN